MRLPRLREQFNPSGTTNTNPDSITVGPDGNLWFTEGSENRIGKLSLASGKITVYNVPTANAALGNIVAGPDGNLSFTEIEGNKIGKISPVTGVITEYSVSTKLVIPLTSAGLTVTYGLPNRMRTKSAKFLRQPMALPNTSYL